MEGSYVGRYRLLHLVGRGGVGEVWRAHDPELDRPVAVKLLHRSSPEDLARFRREALAVAALNHPSVAQLYEFNPDPPFLVMQFVDGVPIDRLPARDARLAALRDAARAVHFAHEKGILHRDVKPANILVDGAGRAFVLDFGLARSVRPDGTDVSLTGDILGTPSYMAPEQARGDVRRLDARTDVYGLGATLYHLLAGRAPHTGPAAYDVIRRVLDEEPPPTGAPRDLEIICRKALEKEPSRRYPSAAALADDLERYLRGDAITARPASAAYRISRRIARNPAAWSLGALAVAALLGGATFGVVNLAASRENYRRRLEDEQRFLSQLRLQELLERTSRRLREIDTALARDVDDATLDAFYTELDAMADALALPNAREAALGYLRGEIRLLQNREAEAVGEFTLALESPETDWSRAMSTRPLAALGRAMANIRQLQDSVIGGGGVSRIRLLERSAGLVPSIEQDLTAASDVPPEAQELARLWGLFMAGDQQAAQEGAEAAVAAGGRNEEYHFLLGSTRREGEGELTIEDMTRALDQHRGHVRARLSRSATNYRLGRYAESEADLTEAIRRKPDYVWAYINRGNSRVQMGRTGVAIADYTRAIELDPEHEVAYSNRGGARFRAGDIAGAMEDLDRALELDPDLSPARINRAGIRHSLGDDAGALEDADVAIARMPGRAEYHVTRANIRLAMRDGEGAMEDAEEAVALNPGLPAAWACRGKVRLASGDAGPGIDDLSAAVDLEPGNWEYWYDRGIARLTNGLYEGAFEDINRAYALDPESAETCVTRGILFQMRGDADAARRDFDRAIDLAPTMSEAWVNRGMLREQTGDLRGALADWEQFLVVAPDHARADQVREWVAEARRRLGP